MAAVLSHFEDRELSANPSTRASRELRQRQTQAESLLWNVVRAKRRCGLKFRRQHPIGPYFADFAGVAGSLIAELDVGYHDHRFAGDMTRQRFLENQGWRVIRVSNVDGLEGVEAVARSIAGHLRVEARFGSQFRVRSGMRYQDP